MSEASAQVEARRGGSSAADFDRGQANAYYTASRELDPSSPDRGKFGSSQNRSNRNTMLPMIAGGVAAGVAGAVANRFLRNPRALRVGSLVEVSKAVHYLAGDLAVVVSPLEWARAGQRDPSPGYLRLKVVKRGPTSGSHPGNLFSVSRRMVLPATGAGQGALLNPQSTLNDHERELWVRNDEGLYNWWRQSRLSMRAFLKGNRAELDSAILSVLNRPPQQKTWRDYAGQNPRRTRRNNGRSYLDLIARKKAEHGSKFDSSDLAPQFIPYFESGKRIVVDFGYATKSGTVGVTTGWKPTFLLMLTKRSIGSSHTLSRRDRIVGVRPNPLTARESAALLREARGSAYVGKASKYDQTHRSFFGGKAVGMTHAVEKFGTKRAKRIASRMRVKARHIGLSSIPKWGAGIDTAADYEAMKNPGVEGFASVRAYRVPSGYEAKVASALRNLFVWAQAQDGRVLTIGKPSIVAKVIRHVCKGKAGTVVNRPMSRRNPSHVRKIHVSRATTDGVVHYSVILDGSAVTAHLSSRSVAVEIAKKTLKQLRGYPAEIFEWDGDTGVERPFSENPRLRHKKVLRNPGTEQSTIDVPFGQGKKYSIAQVQKWVETHGTPAMKKRFAMAMAQYKRFHKGSLPKFITYSTYKMGSHPGISDVEFGVSEGHEWMAAYQVPKSSGKWVDQASGGRYVHAHGDSDIEVDVKKPVNLSKLPLRFHTPDGKAVGVIPSKNVKIGEWYEG